MYNIINVEELKRKRKEFLLTEGLRIKNELSRIDLSDPNNILVYKNLNERLAHVRELLTPSVGELTKTLQFPKNSVVLLFYYFNLPRYSPPLPLPPVPDMVFKYCASEFHEGDRTYLYLDDTTISFICDVLNYPHWLRTFYLTICPKCCIKYGRFPIHLHFFSLLAEEKLVPIAPEAKRFVEDLLTLAEEYDVLKEETYIREIAEKLKLLY